MRNPRNLKNFSVGDTMKKCGSLKHFQTLIARVPLGEFFQKIKTFEGFVCFSHDKVRVIFVHALLHLSSKTKIYYPGSLLQALR